MNAKDMFEKWKSNSRLRDGLAEIVQNQGMPVTEGDLEEWLNKLHAYELEHIKVKQEMMTYLFDSVERGKIE